MTIYFALPSIWVGSPRPLDEGLLIADGRVTFSVYRATSTSGGNTEKWSADGKVVVAEPITIYVGDFRFVVYIGDYFSLGESDALASQYLLKALKKPRKRISRQSRVR